MCFTAHKPPNFQLFLCLRWLAWRHLIIIEFFETRKNENNSYGMYERSIAEIIYNHNVLYSKYLIPLHETSQESVKGEL